MSLLSQVYFFSYRGQSGEIPIFGNGEFWLDFKEKPDNINDFRSVEYAVSHITGLTDVKIEGSLTPLRFVERHGENKVFFREGDAVPKPEVHQPVTESGSTQGTDTGL